jgi:hypothetical protein
MLNEFITELNKLEDQIECSKNFSCTKEPLKDSCNARYQAIADLMECLNDQSITCEFSVPFGTGYVCKCPLRKLIALNIEELNKNNNPKLPK